MWLAEAIEALRAELVQAMASAPVERVRLRPGPTELTVEAALDEKSVPVPQQHEPEPERRRQGRDQVVADQSRR